MVNQLRDMSLFELLPDEEAPETATALARWGDWRNVHVVFAPKFSIRGIMSFIDIISLILTVQIVNTTLHGPLFVAVGTEALFLSIVILLICARTLKQFPWALGLCWFCLPLNLLLNLFFPGRWGLYGLFVICSLVAYRFPLRWSLPLIVVCTLSAMISVGLIHFLQTYQVGDLYTPLILVAIGISVSWVSWARRNQHLLIYRLQQVQERLRAEMARSEALAAERERTRIARDIHDVLSHTLSVLSIQVQAARQLATRDPTRLATKLDDMAALIRESIAESRRVVGLLRESPPPNEVQDSLAAQLHAIATTFSERTGIHCFFGEEGTPPAHEVLSATEYEMLQYALREALTNAHRHGAAHTIWITLRWREAALILQVRDDGTVQPAAVTGSLAQEASSYGHHGLQGMRERAEAQGGEVEAGPLEEGGFAVSIRLPFRSITTVRSGDAQ